MKFAEQIQSKHYLFVVLLEAVRRCWSLVWNKYSGLGGRLRYCGCAWKEALRAQPVFSVVGNTWLQDL